MSMHRVLAIMLCIIPSACVSIDTSPAGKERGISHENRLALNRLALDRLALDRLALDRLVLERISSARMLANAPNDLGSSDEGRELLAYIAQCALADGDVLVVEHDGEAYELPGLLGLAPEWETRAITESEQRLVSACLLALVNAYGVSVSVSLRAEGVLPRSEQERRAYPVYEGTFFGQAFSDDGRWSFYSCRGSSELASLAHSADRHLRACTDRTGDCGITSVGRCRDVCERRSETDGWTNCWAEGVRYAETISVYLRASDPDGRNHRCESDRCDMSAVSGTAGILDCGANDDCVASCEEGAICTVDGSLVNDFTCHVAAAQLGEIDCYGTNNCVIDCSDGALCDIDCFDANNCRVACTGEAACDIRCSRSGKNCNSITCSDGASCAIDCNGIQNCDFDTCDTGAVTCPGDIIVCGRPCP